jgi:hypothetical protein
MHEPSFLVGLELGKDRARLKSVEEGLAAVKKDLNALIGRLRRAAILVSLWTCALLANVSPDRAADFAVEIVMSVLRGR